MKQKAVLFYVINMIRAFHSSAGKIPLVRSIQHMSSTWQKSLISQTPALNHRYLLPSLQKSYFSDDATRYSAHVGNYRQFASLGEHTNIDGTTYKYIVIDNAGNVVDPVSIPNFATNYVPKDGMSPPEQTLNLKYRPFFADPELSPDIGYIKGELSQAESTAKMWRNAHTRMKQSMIDGIYGLFEAVLAVVFFLALWSGLVFLMCEFLPRDRY